MHLRECLVVSLSILLHDQLRLETAAAFGQGNYDIGKGKVSKNVITDRSNVVVLLWSIFIRVVFINVDCSMTL